MKARNCLFGILLMSAGAMAGDNVRYAFECDAPAGHFSYWRRSVSSTEIEVSGNLLMEAVHEDKKWSPIANIVLRKGKDRNGRFGIRLYVSAKTPGAVSVDLLKVGGHDAIGSGSIPHPSKPTPFSLRLDASGLLKATVAGVETSTMIGPFNPDTFELSCSTAEFTFTDVTVTEKSPGPD